MMKNKNKKPKHAFYKEKSKTWVIQRKIKGKTIHFGSYKTIEEADKAVKIYDEIGWDPVKNWHVKAKVMEELYGR